jgi:hypothetical protein
MPLPPRDLSIIGPREGTRFPDVRLPDQSSSDADPSGAGVSSRSPGSIC